MFSSVKVQLKKDVHLTILSVINLTEVTNPMEEKTSNKSACVTFGPKFPTYKDLQSS